MVEAIEEFNKLIQSATSTYIYLSGQITQMDNEQQDILHLIEMSKDSKERSKLATKLKQLRKERRIIKNKFEYYQLLAPFVEKNRSVVGEIQRLLGELRKVEQKQKNPVYVMRTTGDVLEVKNG